MSDQRDHDDEPPRPRVILTEAPDSADEHPAAAAAPPPKAN